MLIMKTNFEARSNSWEEEAFAEDAAQPFGAFIWPPRSYLCSFCRREFRSAQALGGHMNVHRRERARLNQCPGSSLSYHNQSFQVQTSCKSMFDESYLNHQMSSLSKNLDHDLKTRASVSGNQDIFVASTGKEHYKESSYLRSPASSWCNQVPQNIFRVLNSGREDEDDLKKKKRSRVLEEVTILPDLDGTNEEFVSSKRQRIKQSSDQRQRIEESSDQNMGIIEDSSSEDYLDLELRLGDQPRLKRIQ